MEKNYSTTLDYLFSQLPMFQRVGAKAFKKDLKNINLLSEAIGNPHNNFPSIHIAGTNGKGSTAHILSAILQQRGFKTGLYTSPHYRDFRERIKINGGYIDEMAVTDFVEQNRPVFEDIKPSFFEISVAMAFDHFSKNRVDIAIIETGLGGRLDSTNIINPLISVITNISFDHTKFLGDTLKKIAGEKAGIIKKNVPVVIGETHSKTKDVFLCKADSENASIIFADQQFHAVLKSQNINHTIFDIFKEEKVFLKNQKVNLHGSFQSKNLITAIQAIEILENHHPTYLSSDASSRWSGLENIKSLANMIGRWQIIGDGPTILCDSAHNEDGIGIVMKEVQRLEYQNLHMVIGSVFDKDLGKIFPHFPKKAKYYFAKPNIPRGMEAEKLRQIAASYQLKGNAYANVRMALDSAKEVAKKEDLIFVGGSTFVVAEVI